MKVKAKVVAIICLIAVLTLSGRQLLLNSRSLPGSGLSFISAQISPLATGNAHSMVITTDGGLWVFGSTFCDPYSNEITTHFYPTRIKEGVLAVSTNIGEIIWSRGNTQHMVLTSDGNLWVWGVDIRDANVLARNANSQGWGRPSRQFNNLLAPVNVMSNVVSISAGSGHALAIASDDTLWGWGKSWNGQLGESSSDRRGRPTMIMDDVIAVSAGNAHTMMVTSNNILWTCGRNSSGQLGDGTTDERRSPINQKPIKIKHDVIAVSAGDSHSMAITSNGELWAWGCNRYGQLGDGTTKNRYSPIKIMYDVVLVSAGASHTMAVTSDGILWGWGANGSGQLGVGTTENQHNPVMIMDNVVTVSVGHAHTLAITSDGVLWAWGNNSSGQLGDGTTESRHSPVRVMDNVMLP